MDLPESLVPFEQKIKDSVIEFIRITLCDDISLSDTSSKFGGDPYITDMKMYPKDSRGKYMPLLAQINFEEVPSLANFPPSGLLQFYISDNEVYGLDYDSQLSQSDSRILYVPKEQIIGISVFDRKTIRSIDDYFPVPKSFGLTFEKISAPMSPVDFRFDKSIYKGFWDLPREDTDTYWKISQLMGHKIGGYPGFAQDDPRFSRKYSEHTTLLLQIDSEKNPNDNDYRIIWGDSGIANFFIKPEDLKNLNFSNVLYNWDCY